MGTTEMTRVNDVPMQDASTDIWDAKYRLKTKAGEPVDADIEQTFERVARALADVEKTPELRELWRQEFLTALRMGAYPAGRIMSNAGAMEYKPSTSTINCTVSGTIGDSMHDILTKVHEAGMTLRAGCGIGYDYSTLRPRDAFVAGAGASTSGPLSFMDIFDKMCFTVASAGGRRGAQMATFDVSHPDVVEFIRAKREDGRLRQFNLSLLITEEFIQAVKNDGSWPLSFPMTSREIAVDGIDLTDASKVIWREVPGDPEYVVDREGLTACKITKVMRAKQLWDIIMSSTYDYAEPGFILIDKVNEMNNNWFCETIRSTNPCGEQPLPPYGSCLLGSINLTRFVTKPFTADARFDMELYRQTVAVFTRMLDNVVEINGLPLQQQRDEIFRKRRHGMGYLGLGSAITMMGMTYGDEASVQFTEDVTREMAIQGWRTGVELAKEKGPAPIMEEWFEITPTMIRQRPEMLDEGHLVGDKVQGKILLAWYSRYMQFLGSVAPSVQDDIAEHGCRFTHHSSIAPTGTLALSFGNNVSNGIEPSFSHHYARNIIRAGKKSKEKVDVFSYELLAYRRLMDADAMPASLPKHAFSSLPPYFVGADEVPPMGHVDVQAAAQKWIDSSISKTTNVPTEISYEDFKSIYMYAVDKGLKGCTTFRFNPEAFQGVLVNHVDLANTMYRFELEGGDFVDCPGDAEIIYDGETHTAANLFDSLKEGYYGKF